MSGIWTPIPTRAYLWDTAVSTFKGCPVVMSSTADQVTNPARDNTDVIVGIADEDAGPAGFASSVTEKLIAVRLFGVVACYAKGAITAGTYVKVGATISALPTMSGASYTANATLQTVTAATRASAGAQPYPVLGFATTAASADGDIVYIQLTPGAQF